MALAVAGEVSRYVTPYWFPERGYRGVPRRVLRQLERRRLPAELRTSAQRVGTTAELARLGLQRVHQSRINSTLIWRRNLAFDLAMSASLSRDVDVISQYGAALETFRRARAYGRARILDYPIARLTWGSGLLAEEAELWPEFRDSLVGSAALTWDTARLQRLEDELDEASVVVVGSQFAAESFANRLDQNRIRVVPYGVETSRFTPAEERHDGGALRVLFAGQITQRKGVAYLLEAMERLDQSDFELTLCGPVVGSGRWFGRYGGAFTHVEGVRPVDMPAVYRASDVLVLPSLLEGSASVVVEAMACGLPVVVTPNAGADAARDGIEGFVVPIRDPEAIAERLRLLQDDSGLRERMGTAARARALKFDWEHFRTGVAKTLGELRGQEVL